MIARDWGSIEAAVLAPLYAGERRRWLQTLQWDSAPSWQEVEHARVAWGLPGFVAMDVAGVPRGVAFYLQEAERIDIGGLTADCIDATDCLLDALVAAAAEARATTVRILALDAAVALASGLRIRGFDVEPHFYLSRPLTATAVRPHPRPAPAPSSGSGDLDAWRAGDEDAVAALLSRAYDRESAVLFAPHHEAGEWQRYVRNLVSHVGCGTFNATQSALLREGDALRGVALITDIGPRTAHLVQLAVDPCRRGRRTGVHLLEHVSGSLRAAGYSALTLMVAQRNRPARSLYDRAGFRHDATFLGGTLRLQGHQHLRPAI